MNKGPELYTEAIIDIPTFFPYYFCHSSIPTSCHSCLSCQELMSILVSSCYHRAAEVCTHTTATCTWLCCGTSQVVYSDLIVPLAPPHQLQLAQREFSSNLYAHLPIALKFTLNTKGYWGVHRSHSIKW